MGDSKDKHRSPNELIAPAAVVSRLSLYLRELQQLLRDGQETTSSTQLGQLLGFTDAQVRKDLTHFGQFGYPGIGYRCRELVDAVKRILGTHRPWPVCLVGIGNLGQALLGYRGFRDQGFQIVSAFDVDRGKTGASLEGVPVFHMDELPRVVQDMGIRLGIVAVPSPAAQDVANKLVAAGLDGILNFSPVTLSLPDGVSRIGVDLAIELEQLAFAVVNREGKA